MTLLKMANLTNVQIQTVIDTWGQRVAQFPLVVIDCPDGGGGYVQLHCREIPLGSPGPGFGANKYTDGGVAVRWQYKVTVHGKRYVWGSHTIPFLLFAQGSNTASHLCHNPRCHNPLHLSWESLDNNKSRNWCPGPAGGCIHVPACLIRGPLHLLQAEAAAAGPQQVNGAFAI